MAVYDYKAMDLGGGSAVGTIGAETPRSARDQLRSRGLTILSVMEVQPKRMAGALFGRRGRKNTLAVTSFLRDLATLLRAGIALVSALKTLEKQCPRSLKSMIQDVGERISAGASLADSMSRHGHCFDELSVNIVRVGESAGTLDESLLRLAEFREKSQRLKNRISSAMLYPAVVSVIGLAVTIFLMTYVVPQLIDALSESDKPLPAVTRAVKAASDLLMSWWWVLVCAVVVGVVSLRLLIRRERVRLWIHRWTLRVPVLGDLIRKENTSRMAIILSGLLRSGLPFIDAIEITQRTLSNLVFREALDVYKVSVAAGKDVSEPLEQSGVFSPMVVQMLAVGQQSGQLEDMLDQLASTYDEEVITAANRLTTVLEPLMIVLLAIVVGFIALATILPILEVSDVL